MRWLFLKDLQILRRSPLLLVILVVYSLGLGVVVGLSRGSGPSKPRGAVVNEIPPAERVFKLGGETIDINDYARQLFDSIEAVKASSPQDALKKVHDGGGIGALVVPEDFVAKLRGFANFTSNERPSVDFYYEGDNPLKTRYVRSAVTSRVADLNRVLSEKLAKQASRYLDYVLEGGNVPLLGNVLGLQKSELILRAAQQALPKDNAQRGPLNQVADFAHVAAVNLALAKPLLSTIGRPVNADERVLNASAGSDDAYTFALALSIPLMFVCVLLGAGLLALEREENAFGRLVRGLVSRETIIAEKSLLSGVLGALAGVLMLAVLVIGFDVDLARVPATLAVIVVGAAAFGALGVALGAAAREGRTASLLAVLVLLPLAALWLVPSGTVAGGTYDLIRAVSPAFPFRPTLHGLEAGLTGTSLAGSL